MAVFEFFMVEKAFTHVLRTGVGQIGIQETHYAYIVVFILTGMFGTSFWENGVWMFGYHLSIRFMMLIFMISNMVNAAFATLPIIVRSARETNEVNVVIKYLIPFGMTLFAYAFIVPFTEEL